jgi:hypothetical protein
MIIFKIVTKSKIPEPFQSEVTRVNDFIKEMEGFRKSGLLNKQISFSYNDVDNEINIYSDEGRFIRPLFTLTEDKSKLKIYEKDDGSFDKRSENEKGYGKNLKKIIN